MPTTKSDDERRDAVLLQMLKMPPKPHAEMKLGKPRGKRKIIKGKRASASAKR